MKQKSENLHKKECLKRTRIKVCLLKLNQLRLFILKSKGLLPYHELVLKSKVKIIMKV